MITIMDEQDIFRKLGFGLKFNTKRFMEDSKKLHVVSKDKSDAVDPSKLDFFSSDIENKKCIQSSRMLEAEEQDSTSPQRLRKKHKIFIEGSDIPNLLTCFSQLEEEYGMDSSVEQAIKNNLKFTQPTPIQMQAVAVMMHRRELLACAPTGSGKTLAFLIPVIAHLTGKSVTAEMKATTKKKLGFRSLILSPTRELAMQTLMVCKQLMTPCPQSLEPDASTRRPVLNVQILDKSTVKRFQIRGSEYGKKFDIVISTPNRLVHLLRKDPPLIDLSYVEWLIMDESDKLFEEGDKNSFREQLGIIYSSCTSSAVRRALFSATFAFDVEQWCHLNMDNVIKINIGGKNTAVKSVKQRLLFTGNESGKLIALREIFRQGLKPPVLVFVQSKERAKELFAELIYDGMNVDAIHADRTPLQRENAVKCFRSGLVAGAILFSIKKLWDGNEGSTTWILICTELLGRGIDFKGVNLVVNYDFPNSAVAYIHRVGRTGRAGRNGEAVTFFTEDDRPLLRSIANVIKEAGCPIPNYILRLKKIGKGERKTAAKSEVKRPTIRTAPTDVLKGSKRKSGRDDNSTKKMKRNLTDQA